jgi:50S ribosomal subunit-associated GTPase HflX
MIGPGKLEELRRAVKNLRVEKVVFENELKPVQEYNLAKIPLGARHLKDQADLGDFRP